MTQTVEDSQATERERLRRLLSTPPVPAQTRPTEVEDHPAVDRARALTRALRDRDATEVARLAATWTALETFEVACITALAARPDLAAALEVLDLPPEEWSGETLWLESDRWDHGDRDATAEAADVERDRRAVL